MTNEERLTWIEKNRETICKLYPETKTIHGPYISKSDGRVRVVLYDGKGTLGKRITRQFSKLKMEVILGRKLEYHETVDHDDRDKQNDYDYNLKLLSRREHISLDVKRIKQTEAICVWCGTNFVLSRNQHIKENWKEQKAGPFCSKSCSGKYGADVQNGGSEIDRVIYDRGYYTLKETTK